MPEVCADQVAPESLVMTIVPVAPTDQQFAASGHDSPLSVAVVGFWTDHVPAASADGASAKRMMAVAATASRALRARGRA